MNEKWNAYVKNMFKVGTAECAISFAVIAMVLAIMLLSGLFWKKLLDGVADMLMATVEDFVFC